MKTIAVTKVRQKLRDFGLRPMRKGNGSGHEVWVDDEGRTAHPVLRLHEINLQSLQSLAWELQAKQICSRQQFWLAIRNA